MKNIHIHFILFVAAAISSNNAHSQITGFQRIYHSSTAPLYLERPSLSDWSTVVNSAWDSTTGGGVWNITNLGRGLYRIESGGKTLTRLSTADWSKVATTTYSGWSTQKWTLTSNGEGSYRIENAGKALTGDSSFDNSVKTVAYSGLSSQKWFFFAEDKTDWPAGDWKWVYRKVHRSTRFLIDKSDTLVIDTVIQGVTNESSALTVAHARNVCLKRCNLLDVTTNMGLTITGSSNVTVDSCRLSNQIRPTGIHSSFLFINESPNVLIRNTTIENCDGNGVLTKGDASTGLVMDGCTIRNTGRVPYSLTAPFHGIYSKAPDVSYTNNTISACNDGSDISMRNTGVISGNRLFAAKHSLIAYWPDAKAGASAALVISGNTLTQDTYNYTGGTSKAAIVGLNDNRNPNGIAGVYFQTFRIENNQMRVGPGSTSADALVTANWPADNSPGFGNVRITGNTLSDQRTTKNYIGNASLITVSTPNTLQ